MFHSNKYGWSLRFAFFIFFLFSQLAVSQSVEAQEDYTWLAAPTLPYDNCGSPWSAPNPAGHQPFHNAIDLCGGERGDPVLAVADCEVAYVGWWPLANEANGTGHGLIVACWHERNKIYTYDTHLQEALVNVGDFIPKGVTLALQGSSGYANGLPHDHFVTATKDPISIVDVDGCGPSKAEKVACFPNPDDFLGKDTNAQDIGLVSYSPTGEMFEPEDGTPVYTGGLEDLEILYYTRDPNNPASQGPNYSFQVSDSSSSRTEYTFEVTSSKLSRITNSFGKFNSLALWMIGGIFLLCFAFSENFRRGTMIMTIVVIILLLLYLLLPL